MKNCSLITFFAALFGLTSQAAEPTTVKHPDWSDNATIYEVNVRQFTPEGTFNAFAEHLPRLKDLGVDIIWFMPIHPISEANRKGTLGSYYAVKDYKAVNPEFGTFEDFRKVVDKAHQLGMKVIIDWVPNHTGCDNAWVTTHPDRYALDKDGKMYGPFDWTDVYKLDYSNPDTRAAMRSALAYWLTAADIDGFRCDVAMQVPTDFWDETRPVLQALKPDLFMLAEASEPDLARHAFDMSYNWPMKDLFSAIAATAGQYTFKEAEFPERHAADIDSLLALQAEQYPAGTYMMNMVTNHDLNSWEGTEFQRLGNLTKAFAVLTYTLPGMPLIYTGQETGMNRAFEFFEKDQAPEWEPRNEYFTFYQTLNDLKHRRAELSSAQPDALVRYATTSPDIYAFARTKGDSSTIVIANLGAKKEKLKFTGSAPDIATAAAILGSPAKLPKQLLPGEVLVYTTGPDKQ